jgi:uncharacterized membrane protein YedE/YeeE
MSNTRTALVSAAVGGVLFGFGLSMARMTDPQKIWNFLDLGAIPSGGWDPSLAFVMVGGIAVAFFGLRLDRWLRLAKPLAGPAFIKTSRTRVDAPLVIGAAIFGVGWGLSGFCPGPAIADLGLVPGDVYLFVIALFVGSCVAGQFLEWSEPSPTTDTTNAATTISVS